MATFSRLKSLKINTERTVWLTLDDPIVDTGGGTVELELRFAGEANASYWRDVLKVLESERKRGNAADKVTQENIDLGRESNVRLYAKHIVVSWRNVLQDGSDGGVVACPCNPANVEAFLTELLDKDGKDAFGWIKKTATDEAKFRDAPKPDGVALGKP